MKEWLAIETERKYTMNEQWLLQSQFKCFCYAFWVCVICLIGETMQSRSLNDDKLRYETLINQRRTVQHTEEAYNGGMIWFDEYSFGNGSFSLQPCKLNILNAICICVRWGWLDSTV